MVLILSSQPRLKTQLDPNSTQFKPEFSEAHTESGLINPKHRDSVVVLIL